MAFSDHSGKTSTETISKGFSKESKVVPMGGKVPGIQVVTLPIPGRIFQGAASARRFSRETCRTERFFSSFSVKRDAGRVETALS